MLYELSSLPLKGSSWKSITEGNWKIHKNVEIKENTLKQLVKKEITRDISKYSNTKKKQKHDILKHIGYSESSAQGTISSIICFKKEERHLIDSLTLQLKKLEIKE